MPNTMCCTHATVCGGEVLSSWKQSVWIHWAYVPLCNTRGSGGMLPKKLKNGCSEIESEAILESKYMHQFQGFD